MIKEDIKYNGMTRRKYKKWKAKQGTNSTPGISKAETCQATGLDKAMAKYPRSYRTCPVQYTAFYLKKDKMSGRKN